MKTYLIIFQWKGDDLGIHIEAEDFADAIEMVDAMKQTARVEGLVWDRTTGATRGRLH